VAAGQLDELCPVGCAPGLPVSGKCLQEHNAADPIGPQLTDPHSSLDGQKVLTMSDFPFVQSWTQWCKHTAQKLTAQTEFAWRARDVEMVIFNAWGEKKDEHPKLKLTPLPPLRGRWHIHNSVAPNSVAPNPTMQPEIGAHRFRSTKDGACAACG
jgi:hypothetical protein